MSDTPETDAELRRIAETYKGTPVDAVLIHFARRLERKRNRLAEFAKNVAETSSSSRLRREAREALKPE